MGNICLQSDGTAVPIREFDGGSQNSQIPIAGYFLSGCVIRAHRFDVPRRHPSLPRTFAGALCDPRIDCNASTSFAWGYRPAVIRPMAVRLDHSRRLPCVLFTLHASSATAVPMGI